MSSPSDCRFSESHEWYKTEGDVVTVDLVKLIEIKVVSLNDGVAIGDHKWAINFGF